VKFAAEFFTLRRVTQDEIIKQIEDEKDKIKRYHNVKPWRHPSFAWPNKGLKEVNEVKNLSVGALAESFGFTPPPSPPKE
jgi:hypothetical protein